MPSLLATLGLDASGFKGNLDASVRTAENAGERIMASLGKSRSTIYNPREALSNGDAYGKQFGEALLARDIEFATRANRARALLRSRAASQAASAAEASKEYAITAGPDALKAAGEAATKASVPMKMLRHELKYLGGAFGEVAYVILGSFKSPIMWAIGAVIGALYGLHKALQALSPTADTLGVKSLAPKLENFSNKVIEAKASVASFFDEIRRGRGEVDKLNEGLKNSTNITEAWGKGDEKVLEAKRDLALAMAGGNEALKKEINTKFERDKIDRENKRRGEERMKMLETADKAEAKSKELAASVPGLSESATQAERDKEANAERIRNAEENLKQLAKKRAELGPGGFASMHGNAAERTNQEVLDKASAAQPGLITAATKAGEALKRAEKESVELRKSADEKRADADRKMVESAATYKSEKEAQALKEQAAALEEPKKGEGSKALLSRNSLQQIGAYGAANPHEQQLLDHTKRSEGHLREIKEHLVKNQHTPKNRGVEF